MLDNALIFRTSKEMPGIFSSLFGGFFLIKGLALFFQLLVALGIPLAILFAVLHSNQKKPLFASLSRVFSLLSFFSIVVLLIQPWDELFVNLRHSINFAKFGVFSFHEKSLAEGTVDFLPYFLIGLLVKVGLPAIELAFIQSFIGGLVCILIGAKLLVKWGWKQSNTWGIFILATFAPLCINSSHGFTATTFSACILSSIFFLWFSPKKRIGYLLLSLIPLIRTEGIWWVILCVCHLSLTQRKDRRSHLLLGSLCFLPFFVHSLIRWKVYGDVIPLPIQFKASLGDLFYFSIGLRNLAADLVSGLGIYSLIAYLLSTQGKKKNEPLQIAGLLFLFCLPYYLSGGDWFPSGWGRYLLPFNLYLLLLGIIGATEIIHKGSTSEKTQFIGFASVTVILIAVIPFGSYPRLLEDIFQPKKALSHIGYKKTKRTNFRIHHLSQVGRHLAETTSPTDLIASSEMATIMYFANREALDLLGLTNKEIISQPLRRPPSLFRQPPAYNELPYLIFKRVNPTLVEKYRPPFIYTFDFVLEDLLEHVRFEELTDADIKTALKRWETNFKGLLDPLYGGVETLLKLNYTPVVVLYKNKFGTMYFVSKEKLLEHTERLKELAAF